MWAVKQNIQFLTGGDMAVERLLLLLISNENEWLE